MDGVLLDSSPIHDAAYQEALRSVPISNFRYSRVAGMRSADGMRVIFVDSGIECTDERIAELAAAKTRIALERILAENPVVPGAIHVLKALSARMPLALASSASEVSVKAFLARNSLESVFGCALHAGDVRIAKPAPDIFRLAIERLGLAPADAMVVEDAVAGIQAAKAAGAIACGIPSTSPAVELRAAGADLLIDRLEDLLDIGVLA